MKRPIKIFIKILPFLALLLCLEGCYDRRELNTLGYVMGVAIDKADKDGETKLTLQFADISDKKSSKSSGTTKSGESSSSAYLNVSNTGTNINLIIREVEHKMSRKVYTPHNQIIVFSEDFARVGVRDSLDFFARAPEARMTLYILIARGEASDLLDVEPQFEEMPANEIAQMIKGQNVTSQIPIVTEFEFVTMMLSKTTSPVAPILEIKEDGESRMVTCVGSAVFKGSKMIGELDYKETRGLLYVKNKVKTGIISVDVCGERAAMEIRKAKGSVTPEIKEDGTIIFKVDVEELVGIGDQSGTINLADPEHMPALVEETKRATTAEIQSAVDKSKELNADIFGFGEYIYRKYPQKWKDLKDNWDELYQDIKVEINVKVEPDGSGRSVKPLTPED